MLMSGKYLFIANFCLNGGNARACTWRRRGRTTVRVGVAFTETAFDACNLGCAQSSTILRTHANLVVPVGLKAGRDAARRSAHPRLLRVRARRRVDALMRPILRAA
eukprot:1948098-Pleurochrysis_carterae.AAC.3